MQPQWSFLPLFFCHTSFPVFITSFLWLELYIPESDYWVEGKAAEGYLLCWSLFSRSTSVCSVRIGVRTGRNKKDSLTQCGWVFRGH